MLVLKFVALAAIVLSALALVTWFLARALWRGLILPLAFAAAALAIFVLGAGLVLDDAASKDDAVLMAGLRAAPLAPVILTVLLAVVAGAASYRRFTAAVKGTSHDGITLSADAVGATRDEALRAALALLAGYGELAAGLRERCVTTIGHVAGGGDDRSPDGPGQFTHLLVDADLPGFGLPLAVSRRTVRAAQRGRKPVATLHCRAQWPDAREPEGARPGWAHIALRLPDWGAAAVTVTADKPGDLVERWGELFGLPWRELTSASVSGSAVTADGFWPLTVRFTDGPTGR